VYHQLAHAAFLQWVDDLPGAEDLPAIIHQLVRSGLEMLQYSPVPKKIRMQPADLEKIYQVADYLRSAKEELLIEELAQQFKISVYKLNTGFKQVYGHLILQHRQEEKMRLARQLLKEQQYSVKQVAYMLNYYPQNFVRAFKQRFGYTPGRNLFYP
jgi:AraC-like DNA-binding protein